MKRIILCLCLFIFIRTEAQQINPVPDYIFSNKMSIGRTATTDTAAYFSIGPRYGAVRGFMPPMVTDTAVITTGKRNGLTIFSIQKNKYMYWDSVRVRWSDFAGSSGAYIFASDTSSMLSPYLRKSDTSSMLSPYIRAAGNGLTKSGQSLIVDTAAVATRARVQKAVDSLNTAATGKVNVSDTSTMLAPYSRGAGAGNYMAEWLNSRRLDTANMYYANGRFAVGSTTTTNGVFNVYGGQAYFDTSLKVGAQTLLADEGKNEVYVNTTTDAGAFTLQINGGIYTTREGIYLDGFKDWQVETNNGSLLFYNRSTNVRRLVIDSAGTLSVGAIDNDFGASAIFRVNPNTNETYIGSLVDYGNYTLQVDGNFYGRGTGTFTKEISATSATTNAGNPSAATFYSGDDGAAIWRAALSLQHNSDVSISAGSGIGIVFSPLASTGSVFYGSAGIKAIRPNNTANNQNTDLTFITRAGASNATTDTEKMRIKSDGEVLINTTTDAGAYALQVAGAIYNTTTITTGAPTGGSIKPWRLGEAATVSPTSPNRTIRVEIDGTVYYIHAKTTND